MSRYIDTAKIKEAFEEHTEIKPYIVDMVIGTIPSVDVRENVRGEWIDKGKNWTVTNEAISMEIPVKECSVCGRSYLYIITDRFCPNCGADMRPISALSENAEIVSKAKGAQDD